MRNIKQNLINSLFSSTKNEIEKRLKEFEQLNKQDNQTWFSELCFCILTANSKAQTAINIQQEILPKGFLEKTTEQIAQIIKKHGHRFHNNKASYIVAARKFAIIKDVLQGMSDLQAREFLVKNIKGLGYKESSHFLRNVGYKNLAIIDRHILRFMHQNKLICEIPKTITSKKYLEFENILLNFQIPLNKLDLMIWATMTGKVLK